MKKILLFTSLCLCAVFVSAQQTLNWDISFESENLTDATEVKVTVNNTDTCSFIESLFFPFDMYSKTVESYGNIYKTVIPFPILDILNLFTEAGWSVDHVFYEGTVSDRCEINISLISVDGNPKGFFNSINKQRTYMFGLSYDDDILAVYPPNVSKAHIRYMELLKDKYNINKNMYIFDRSCLNNIILLYISGWRIDFLELGFYNGYERKYFFFSHEYEPEE